MRGLLIAMSIVGVIGLAVWAYSENYKTKATLDEISALNQEISQAKSRLRVLNAEWAYLNRPERLEELAKLNFGELQLIDLAPDHFASIEEIAYPRQIVAPLAPITEPVEVMSRGAAQ